MKNPRGRPRGPRYLERQTAAAKRLVKSGLITPEILGPEVREKPPITETPEYGLVFNFLKSITKIKQSIAQTRNQYPTRHVGGKQVVLDDDTQRLMSRGIIMRPTTRLRYDHLREVCTSSTLIGAIHQVYADDARAHGVPDKETGFVVRLRDKDKKPSNPDRARIYEKERLIEYMGDKTLNTWGERDRLPDVLEMATRDVMGIDKVAYLRTWNRRRQIIDVTYLDPATIFKVDPTTGYDGDQSVTHVQVIDGNVIDTFEAGRIIMRNRTQLSDIRMRGQGWSPVESCIFEVMGGVYAMKHNMDRFNGRNPPKMILSSESNISDEMKELLEEIWEMNYSGDSMEYRIPMLHGVKDLAVHNLQTEQDGIFPQFIQNCFSLILARHGMDSAELGLNFNQSKTLSEPSVDGRAQFSRNRRHGAVMAFHERSIRDIFDDESEKTPLVFAFTGVLVEDADKKLDRMVKQLGNFVPLDVILAQNDMPSYGEFVEKYFEDKSDPRIEQLKLLGAGFWNQQFMQEFGKIISPQQSPPPGMGGGELPPPGGPGGIDEDPAPSDSSGDEDTPDFQFDDEEPNSGGQSDEGDPTGGIQFADDSTGEQ